MEVNKYHLQVFLQDLYNLSNDWQMYRIIIKILSVHDHGIQVGYIHHSVSVSIVCDLHSLGPVALGV